MATHKPKISNSVLGIASIFAIVLIAIFAITIRANNATNTLPVQNSDPAGLATGVLAGQDVVSNSPLCKLIVGQTTVYDGTTMAISLEAGDATYYSGYSISVTTVNNNGCVVDVSGTSDYLAIGQIQRLGAVYVTVKDVVN